MAIVDVRNLSYTYPAGQVPALKNVTFQVEPGQLVGVVGANDAGKSTLCMVLAGLIPALFHGQMRGEVTICGLDTHRNSPGDFAGQVGLVLQNPANQLSGMRYTVLEEVAFGLENIGLARAEMLPRVERALIRVGLADLKDRSPYTLSSGQQQRLAIASILALEPRVLILDEPTSSLDPQGSEEIFKIVQDLVRMGMTVIIAEHHLEWIARYTQRVIALDGGEVLLDGAPQDVLASPLLLQAGIGWLRFTQAAQIALSRGLWPPKRLLPVTLEGAVLGFEEAGADSVGRE